MSVSPCSVDNGYCDSCKLEPKFRTTGCLNVEKDSMEYNNAFLNYDNDEMTIKEWFEMHPPPVRPNWTKLVQRRKTIIAVIGLADCMERFTMEDIMWCVNGEGDDDITMEKAKELYDTLESWKVWKNNLNEGVPEWIQGYVDYDLIASAMVDNDEILVLEYDWNLQSYDNARLDKGAVMYKDTIIISLKN